MSDVTTEVMAAGKVAPRSRIWLWVVVAFVVQIAVWTGWLVFASHHRVEEVPLVTGPSRSAGN